MTGRLLGGTSEAAPLPRVSPGRGEELQSDVVGVAEREPRTVGRIDDSTVRDAERVQLRLPLLELCPIGATERDVVQPGTQLVEGCCTRWLGVLVDAEE